MSRGIFHYHTGVAISLYLLFALEAEDGASHHRKHRTAPNINSVSSRNLELEAVEILGY